MVAHLILIVPYFLIIALLSADPASARIHAAGHHLAFLCQSICVEEKSQLLDLSISSWHPFCIHYGASWFEMYNTLLLFTELTEIPQKLDQGVATSAKRVDTPRETSGDESIGSPC